MKRTYKRRPESVLRPAREELARLFEEAKEYLAAGKPDMAQRRVRKARRIAMKVQLRLTPYADRYCRSCSSYLEQGTNATIRVRHSVRILRCQACGHVRRKPLQQQV